MKTTPNPFPARFRRLREGPASLTDRSRQPSGSLSRLLNMSRLLFVTGLVAALLCAAPGNAQDDDYARQVAQERRQAELEAPQLAEVLGLEPGRTVADIGTGGGAMTVVLGRLVGSGRVYATDVEQRSLTITREYATKEGLTNITVIEGGATSTNLPSECCDALFLRNVYHHVAEPAAFNKSLYATAKRGARLAIIDAPPGKGSELPAGVPANRGGHGIPAAVVIDELSAAGFVHVRTIQGWPPGGTYQTVFLVLFEKK
jgi:SAM-dependent methyltransferase